MLQSRREFNSKLLGSLIACGFIESVYAARLFGDEVKPIVGQWLTDLANATRELRGHKLTDTEFQAKMEELYRHVNLPELIKHIRLDQLAASSKLPENGAANFAIDFSKIEGAGQAELWQADFRHEEGPFDRAARARQHVHRLHRAPRRFSGQALRQARDAQGSLHHQADHRPRVQAGRTLDDFRPQRQCSLVQVRFGYGLHFQRACGGLRSVDHGAVRPTVSRCGGRKTFRRVDQGEKDDLVAVSQEIWMRLEPTKHTNHTKKNSFRVVRVFRGLGYL